MKKIAALTVIFAFILIFFSSCAKKTDPLAYEKGKINAEITLTMNGTCLRAKMELMPIEESGERDASLVFSFPESVNGLSVSRKNGKVSAVLGDLTLSELDGTEFLATVELFSTCGTVVSAETEETDAETLTRLSVVSDGGTYTVWLRRDGMPKKIAHENMTVDIVWIETQ